MNTTTTENTHRSERGAGLIAAIFMLLIVSTTGVALLFLTQTEVKMSSSSIRLKQAFFLAEAGLESARTMLHAGNIDNDFDDELLALSVDGTLDFDADALAVTWDADGNPTGLTGFNDDMPLVPLTPLGNGWHAAFVTNDPAEDPTDPDDTNKRVMITGIGLGPDRAMEVVQAIVEFEEFLPSMPPATITLLGPSPYFDGGHADPHHFSGDDCGGFGDPTIRVPVVGTIGPEAEAQSETGIHYDEETDEGPDYESGPWVREDTFADLTDAANEPTLGQDIDPAWLSCEFVRGLVEDGRNFADLLCGTGCDVSGGAPGDLIVVDGDAEVLPPGGSGTLIVTGELRYNGRAGWNGMILVFGEGRFIHEGGGNGTISGAIMVADIAGPDNVYGTDDDCTGGDGGFGSASWHLNGGGNADTLYCNADLLSNKPRPPYEVQTFRQR